MKLSKRDRGTAERLMVCVVDVWVTVASDAVIRHRRSLDGLSEVERVLSTFGLAPPAL